MTETITELKNPIPAEQNMPTVTMGFGSLQSFELIQRAAKLLASSSLIPKEYQQNIPNCVIALNMAQRLGADPLMVMQNLYVVHGRPGWSSQFLIASFNQCGRFSAMRFEFFGDRNKDYWGCRAWAIEKDTDTRIEGADVTIAIAKSEGWYGRNGSKWKNMPQQMLMYRAASWFVRAYAPEISMGLQTAEEIHDVFDAERDKDGRFAVDIEQMKEDQESETIDADTGEITKPEQDKPKRGTKSTKPSSVDQKEPPPFDELGPIPGMDDEMVLE